MAGRRFFIGDTMEMEHSEMGWQRPWPTLLVVRDFKPFPAVSLCRHGNIAQVWGEMKPSPRNPHRLLSSIGFSHRGIDEIKTCVCARR